MAIKEVTSPVVVQRIEGAPGPEGPMGPPGEPGPSLEEVVEILKNDNEFMARLAMKQSWDFQIIRDEMGRAQSIRAVPLVYLED